MVGRVPDTPSTTLSLWQRVVPLPDGAELKGTQMHQLRFALCKKIPGGAGGFFYLNNYFAVSSGTTETVLRSFNPRLNFTVPVTLANIVWSLPIPTFNPG